MFYEVDGFGIKGHAAFDALRSAAVPTIAVVTGAAIGAGVNLPLACDIVVAGTSARFDPRFLDVGIHPGGGHLFLLQQRVGRQGARELAQRFLMALVRDLGEVARQFEAHALARADRP